MLKLSIILAICLLSIQIYSKDLSQVANQLTLVRYELLFNGLASSDVQPDQLSSETNKLVKEHIEEIEIPLLKL